MRKAILFSIICLAISFPAIAEEHELLWDDGSPDGAPYDSDGPDLRVATDYTAPADCYLVRLKFHLPANPAGTEVGLYAYADNGSIPGAELGYISYTGVVSGWNEVDVLPMEVTFDDAEEFWVGLATAGDADRINSYSYDSPGHSMYYSFNGGSTWTVWSNVGLMVRAIVDDDMDPPYVDDEDPADGDTDVPVDTDIVFHILDDDVGVDDSSITDDAVEVTANGTEVSGTLDITGDEADYTVTFTPDDDLPYDTDITVEVSPDGGDTIVDLLGNEMPEESWTFTTAIDDTSVQPVSFGKIKALMTGKDGSDEGVLPPEQR